jgi:hypothetical protein
MEFVKYLEEERPGKGLPIFGDGITSHNCSRVLKRFDLN